MKKEHSGDILQVFLMLLITVLTQFVSIYKSAIIASNFGVGTELDAYNFSNNLTLFFLSFIFSGITTILIPAYLQEKSREAIDTFLTVVFSVTFLMLAITFIFRDGITILLTDRDSVFRHYVSTLLLFTMMIQGFTAILGVTSAYFQCKNKFNIPKIIQLLSNIAAVALLVVKKDFTVYEYVTVLLAASMLQFCADVFAAIRCGFRFKPAVALKNSEFKELLQLFVPTLFSTGAFQIQSFIDSLLASNLPTGQLTLLTYSNTIANMINTLLIGNIVVYFFPKLVKNLKRNHEDGKKSLWKYTGFAHYAICLVGVGFVACGREFIAIIYQNGKFDEKAVWAVYIGACIYAIGQQNNIIRDLIYRFFYTMHDTKTTLYNSVLVSMSNIILSVILVRYLDVYGIILGTVLAGLLSLCMIIWRFKRKFGLGEGFRDAFREYIRTDIISICVIVCIVIAKMYLHIQNQIVSFLFYGGVSVGLYLMFSFILRSKILKRI